MKEPCHDTGKSTCNKSHHYAEPHGHTVSNQNRTDDDNGVPLSSREYDYGTLAENIVKPTSTREHYYINWTPSVVAVTSDKTYTAQYEPIVYSAMSRPSEFMGQNRIEGVANTYDADPETYAYNTSTSSYAYINCLRKFNISLPSEAKVIGVSLFVKCSTDNSGSSNYIYVDLWRQDSATSTAKSEIIRNHYLIDGVATSPQYVEMPIDLDVLTNALSYTATIVDWLNPSTYPMPSVDVHFLGSSKGSTKVYDIYLQAKYTMV